MFQWYTMRCTWLRGCWPETLLQASYCMRCADAYVSRLETPQEQSWRPSTRLLMWKACSTSPLSLLSPELSYLPHSRPCNYVHWDGRWQRLPSHWIFLSLFLPQLFQRGFLFLRPPVCRLRCGGGTPSGPREARASGCCGGLFSIVWCELRYTLYICTC